MTTPNSDGPDISHYQTLTGRPVDPEWRLFSHKATEGRSGGDKTFPGRWQWMREQGFRWRGAYHWIRSDSSIADQAANLCARIDNLGGLMRGEFIQCDWETTTNVATPTSLMAAEWCDRVQQHYGRPSVIMYSSDWLPDSTLDPDKLAEFFEWRQENPTFPYWHANYNTGDRATGGWAECERYDAAVWQWTSSYTHPAIGGRFDMNHVFAPAVLDLITDQATPAPPPPEEDDMAKLIIEDPVLRGDFLIDGTPLSAEAAAELEQHQGFVRVQQDHEYWRAAILHKMGSEAAGKYALRTVPT